MTDKVIKVNVTATKKQSVNISAGNVQNQITATPDSSQYYSNLSKSWAIASGLILNEDYSSKHYANESANSASSAKNYADASQATYTNVQNVANEALTDIENARVDAVDNITTVKSESIASVEAKSNEAVSAVNNGIANIEAKSNEASTLVNAGIAEINTTKTNAVNAVTTTKNNAVTEINKEVTDGKKELNDIIEAGGLNINDKLTNCLLEVPQNINLELNNGTLTLKAGSKVIVPNGFEANGTTPKFDEVIFKTDFKVSAGAGNKTLFVTIDGTDVLSITSNKVISGVTDSLANTTWHAWYDTTNNIVKRYGTDAGTYKQVSFPIAITTFSDATICSSIDQVFQGMGYIGSTIWVGKGVKVLIPDGRNVDGTLKNTEYTTDNVKTFSYTYQITNSPFYIQGNNVGSDSNVTFFEDKLEIVKPASYQRAFVTQDNQWYTRNANSTTWNKVSICVLGICDKGVDGTVNYIQPKQPVRLVDWNDVNPSKIDGQWVAKSLLIAENVTVPITEDIVSQYFSYDLSEYLPKDNYNYEVILSINAWTGNKTNSIVALTAVGNGTQNNKDLWVRILGLRSVSATPLSMYDAGSVYIGSNRVLKIVYGALVAEGLIQSIHAEGYRRIGTNE